MAVFIIVVVILILTVLLHRLVALVLPPKYPLTIPSIPLFVPLLPLFLDIDQSTLFTRYIRQPLLTHGAVKIFFAGQWNVLVHRPSYLAELFKNEAQWQKSGNQKKIPRSLLAAFLGDNVISATGPTWMHYRGIVAPGLQREFDVGKVRRNAEALSHFVARESGATAMQGIVQRYTTANTMQVILGVDVDDDALECLHALQTCIKQHIFKPLFMTFSFLDHPFTPGRREAWDAVARFRTRLKEVVLAAHEGFAADQETVGARLVAARKLGLLTDTQFMDNLTVLFVASQENTQLWLLSTLYLLAKHPASQDRISDETILQGADVSNTPYLTSVLYEVLRLYPPIGQLINRRAAACSLLGGSLCIPQGTYLGYNCYSTNRDPGAWGPSADDFVPERWGATMDEVRAHVRTRTARAEFVSFHGGRRACLGERFALLVARCTVRELVRRFRWRVDDSWEDRKTQVSVLGCGNRRKRVRSVLTSDAAGRLGRCILAG